MGFRCSLLGHDYGDSDVDRDREERGDEVVVTVHEYQTCDRCGRTKTVSENKEVTSIASEADVPGPADGDTQLESLQEPFSGADDDTAADVTESVDDSEDEMPVDDAMIIDADEESTATDGPDEGARSATDTVDEAGDSPRGSGKEGDDTEAEYTPADGPGTTASTPDQAAGTADPLDPGASTSTEPPEADSPGAGDGDTGGQGSATADGVQDDAVILDEGDEPDDRDYGEWPGKEDGKSTQQDGQYTEWPEKGGEDQGFTASTPDEDTRPDVEFGSKLAPQSEEPPEESDTAAEPAPAEATSEPVSTDRGPESTGITSVGSVPRPDMAHRTEGQTELFCPECETTSRSRASLRQGDICPECKRGYLTERERNK